jgi:hypothetical protein
VADVPRHAVDRDACREEVDDLTPDLSAAVDRLENGRGTLKNVLHQALELLRYRTGVDPSAAEPETWRDLRTAAQAATALFAAATGDGEIEAEVTRPMRLPATGPTIAANAGHWLTGAWLAVIDRNDELIQRLCAVPLDTLRASGAEHDDYMYPWVETVQAFLAHREVTPEMFRAAMDGTDPDTARITPRRIMLQLVYPPIKMFYYLLRRDEEKFTAATVSALDDHRSYWTGDEGSAEDPDGFLALAPLAVAVLARSAGMPVDVASDYLPSNFLLGIRPPT